MPDFSSVELEILEGSGRVRKHRPYKTIIRLFDSCLGEQNQRLNYTTEPDAG